MNENLFVKAIKVEEKSRNFDQVRRLLGALKDVPFDLLTVIALIPLNESNTKLLLNEFAPTIHTFAPFIDPIPVVGKFILLVTVNFTGDSDVFIPILPLVDEIPLVSKKPDVFFLIK